MRLLQFYIGYIWRFIKFYFKAKTIYDFHSPFVVSFLTFVFPEDRRDYYSFAAIESFRRQLLSNRYPVRITDFGAGSKVNSSQTRSIGNIVRFGAVSARTGRHLFRAVLYSGPSNILEMGTSLGISTLYLRMAGRRGLFITLEGCPEIAAEARNNLARMGCADVEVVEGAFADTLPEVLTRFGQLDFLYLDGDHRGVASYRYFIECLAKAGPRSIFVIADIHWSVDMENAWEQMRRHPRVSLSVDVFGQGYLFFDESLKVPQHIEYLPWYFKPWRSGIFH